MWKHPKDRMRVKAMSIWRVCLQKRVSDIFIKIKIIIESYSSSQTTSIYPIPESISLIFNEKLDAEISLILQKRANTILFLLQKRVCFTNNNLIHLPIVQAVLQYLIHSLCVHWLVIIRYKLFGSVPKLKIARQLLYVTIWEKLPWLVSILVLFRLISFD